MTSSCKWSILSFWLPWAKFSGRHHSALWRTNSRVCKVCCVQYLLVFRLISGYTGERLIPGLRQKDWILQASLLTVTSLWTHKEGSKGEIHSERLMLISDQAKDLVKNCFEGGGLHVSFSTSGLHPGSWINRLFESRKVSCDDLCGESERFSVGVIWRCFARVKCGNIMSGFRKCCDFREIFVWLPRLLTVIWLRKLCVKHKNACLDLLTRG